MAEIVIKHEETEITIDSKAISVFAPIINLESDKSNRLSYVLSSGGSL